MRLTPKSVDSEDRLLSTMWAGFIQSAEGLKRKDGGPLKKFCLQNAFELKTATHTPVRTSSLLATLTNFRLANLNNSMTQFLKINFCMCTYSIGFIFEAINSIVFLELITFTF